ncbi:MAG TPA: hypothetical protein VGA99_12745, partial [bacterium]
ALIEKVFAPSPGDNRLLIIVDVPNERVGDNHSWCDRRVMAREWLIILQSIQSDLGLEAIDLIYYENVGSNNADLPHLGFRWPGDPLTISANLLHAGTQSLALIENLGAADIILAPTEFSATAPLKVLAKQHRFRAATMPGFSREMIPALGVDYDTVHQRVMNLKTRLDEAENARLRFEALGKEQRLFLDLRFRKAHASSGLLHERGMAGNLPSGEAYIVPYEGEGKETSRSAGVLPVQFGTEIVLYEIRENRAVAVSSVGPMSQVEKRKLEAEPAYGNLAELGLGVLSALGVRAIGETLLDEKLGLHIAFGRSDHFGGAVSPRDFRDAGHVIHIDRIYIPEVQNQIKVKEVVLAYPDGQDEVIIKDGQYTVL